MPEVSTSARVAVVNDSEAFLDLVGEILTAAGYEVTTHLAEDLRLYELAALDPDLIILDLVMVGRAVASGWDLLMLSRAHPQLESVPIIVCSADHHQLRRREAELAHMPRTSVLSKPFSLEELEEAVRAALDGLEAEAS